MRHLAPAAVLLMVAGCGTLEPTASRGPVTTRADHAAAAAASLSDYRRSRGLPPVQVDQVLMRVAEHQARAMADTGTFSHDAAGSFNARLRRFDVRHRAAAENLSAGSRTVGEVMQRWKASAGHNDNLLLPEATRIGLVQAEAPQSRFGSYWVLVLAD